MLLTIDIGNTNITIGLYDGDQLGPRWRLATAHERMPDEYGLQFVGLLNHSGHSMDEITGISLASVVPPLTSKIIEACRTYLQQEALVVDAGVKTGVRIRYEDPRAVGADRILFGTDLPFLDPRPQLGRVAFAKISDDEKRLVLGLNAARVLGIP